MTLSVCFLKLERKGNNNNEEQFQSIEIDNFYFPLKNDKHCVVSIDRSVFFWI